jgi:hypothetical protein
MVLTKSLTALCDLFLNGACNEIKVLVPYPIEEVDEELCKLGWKETTDSHGNAVFLPSDRDDDLDFRTWITITRECEDETTIRFGHL